MKKLLLSLLFYGSLQATTYNVTTNSPDSTNTTSLPYAMLNAKAGDTIDCTLIAGETITLTQSLPAVAGITITGGSGAPVTIDGTNTYQIFSAAVGTISLQNCIINNGHSQGAVGGSGYGGGGGGAGGGGGLYIHNGASVSITTSQFSGCSATGGAGGAGNGVVSGGGGGGGYGDGTGTIGIGGAGGEGGGGGGGGGNTGGGAGGAGATTGGDSGLPGSNGIFFGGGGGGGAGAGAYEGATGGTSGITSPFPGGTPSGGNAGGGAGIGGGGGTATATAGGVGGKGAGGDSGFAGGGGGGGGGSGTPTDTGGAGTGTGGGGGGSIGVGGAGGLDGGGGGGGAMAYGGGKGGFGAGGGGGSTGGGSFFGGGAGASGADPGGGGGAAMGGAILIQNGGQLTVGEGLTITGSSLTAGVGGSGTVMGSSGTTYGLDIFLRSGGALIFNNSTGALTINNPIISDVNVGGGGTGGGINMTGTSIVTLPAGSNYTGVTNFGAGTIQISADTALGSKNAGNAANLVFNGGTLEVSSSFTLSTVRTVTLTGNGTLNIDPGATFTIDNSTNAITGGGGLIKSGAGTLVLIGSATDGNTYTGGTTFNAGILETAADKYLGGAGGILTFNGGTLQMDTGYSSSSRIISLSSTGTIDTQGNSVTFSGSINGGGSLTFVAGMGTVLLTGQNSNTGTLTISTGTLQGSSTSLVSNIVDSAGAAVIFDQSSNGTYNAAISGSGSLTKEGSGTLVMTGNSSAFTGDISLSVGQLTVNGTLGGTNLVSEAGTTLSGLNGTYAIANTTVNGFLQPGSGSSIGTLTFTGNVLLSEAVGHPATELDIGISPTSADFLNVGGTLTRGGALVIQPQSGFYGFGDLYPIIQAGTFAGVFSSTSVTNSNFDVTIETIGNTMYAKVVVLQPFLGFPFSNVNTRSVGDNLDALSSAGDVDLNSPLARAVDSLIGHTDGQINAALDQLHPAMFSGFYDLQAQVGAQIITFFHKRPSPSYNCGGVKRIWAEPYGNWLDQKDLGIEIGFNAYSKGIALGMDRQLSDCIVAGIGGAWNHTELRWHGERGHANIDGFFGGAYLDFTGDNVYIGTSVLAGRDFYNTFRKITFGNVNEDASGDYKALDLLAQLSTAYFLGPDKCCLLPYFNLDFFYLRQKAFSENSAPGLNLDVRDNAGATMRSELGLGLQVIDRNRRETVCISPQVAMGWTCICPLFREDYVSTFEGQTIPFSVVGWDHTWQLFTLRFGLTLSYTCYSLSGEYLYELAPQNGTPLTEQKCNLRFDFNW